MLSTNEIVDNNFCLEGSPLESIKNLDQDSLSEIWNEYKDKSGGADNSWSKNVWSR